eukprot:6412181-Prymnesium_polylepis.1
MRLRLVEAVVSALVLAELAEPVKFVELLIFAVQRASRPAAGIPAVERAISAPPLEWRRLVLVGTHRRHAAWRRR